MFKRFIVLLSLFSSLTFACGLHQSTGFNLVTEPGSLEVFQQVIGVRQNDEFGNVNKPDHFYLYTIKGALEKPSKHKLSFVLFEAVKGHYSDFLVEEKVVTQGKNELPTPQEIMVISELDILDALASGSIDWQSAKHYSLVKVLGPEDKQQQLDRWFEEIF